MPTRGHPSLPAPALVAPALVAPALVAPALVAPALVAHALVVLALVGGCGSSSHGSDAGGEADRRIAPPEGGAPADGAMDADSRPPGDGSPGGCGRAGSAATGPRVVLGTGINEFLLVPETGGELELDEGSQGGWHIYGAVRLHELAIEDLPLSYRVRDAASGAPLTLENRVLLNERRALREGDHWVRPGDRLIFDIVDPGEVVGRQVEVTATVEPPESEPLCDVRVVTVVDRE